MKKIVIFLALVSLGTLCFAHPPKDVTVSYDPAGQMLTVTVTHLIKQSPITDPAKHHLKDISVTINGAEAVVTNYDYQEFDEGEIVVFHLNLKPGDKVMVAAECSLRGENSTEYVVPTT
jgi:hypothetical protein